MKLDKFFIHCFSQKKLLKKYTIAQLNQCKYKNGYYIYKLGKSETSEHYILILKLTDKLDLRRDEKNIALSNVSINIHGKT